MLETSDFQIELELAPGRPADIDMTAFDQNALASLSPYEVAFFNTHCTGRMTTVPFELIHSSFEHHARLAPDVVAVEHASQGESITFGDLDRAANALAHRLRSQGIVPGQRVCILSKRSVANVIAVLSVLKAGGQYVPLDCATITDDTLAHALVDSGAALVLCMGDYLHRVSGVPVVHLEEAIRETEGGDHSKPEELARGSDGVYVIYTSGTTGKPKGVDVRHSGVTNCEWSSLNWRRVLVLTASVLLQSPGNVGMKPGMRVAQLLNVAFDMGAWELLGAMSNGCTLCLRGLKSAQWRSVLKTVDIVIATPSVLAPHHPADYPTIKHVITGGEPCPQGERHLEARGASPGSLSACADMGRARRQMVSIHQLQQLLWPHRDQHCQHCPAPQDRGASQHRTARAEHDALRAR